MRVDKGRIGNPFQGLPCFAKSAPSGFIFRESSAFARNSYSVSRAWARDNQIHKTTKINCKNKRILRQAKYPHNLFNFLLVLMWFSRLALTLIATFFLESRPTHHHHHLHQSAALSSISAPQAENSHNNPIPIPIPDHRTDRKPKVTSASAALLLRTQAKE